MTKIKLTIFISSILLFIFLITSIIISSININKFDTSKIVSIYTRDNASGTRQEFFKQLDFKEAISKDEYLYNPVITTSNGEMLESIKNDKYGIGFASFSSVNNIKGIKKIKINNIECNKETIINNTYPLLRKFNYLTRNNTDRKTSSAIKIFNTYIESLEGVNIIESEGGLVKRIDKKHFNEYDLRKEIEEIKDKNITLSIGGSTSVSKIAEKLVRSFSLDTGIKINFKEQYTGSTDAVRYTKNEAPEILRLDFGFMSRGLQDSEISSSYNYYTLCSDGISVIVNSKNTIDNISKEALKEIYKQKIKWSNVIVWKDENNDSD